MKEYNSIEFGERLNNIMLDNDMTPDKLARMLGCGTRTIQYWLDGESDPTVQYLYEICRIFNVSADYILFGEYVEDKHIKKKVIKALSVFGGVAYECPCCGNDVVEDAKLHDYCSWCGQRLDWGEDDE